MARGARRSLREPEARTGSGTPREEGAIWRMTRCGRRSPSDDAQVVRVARERDDIVGKNRAAGVPARWMSREALRAQSLPGSDSPISPARAIEDVRVRATDRLPAATRRAKRGPLGPTAPRERRIRSERFWPKTRPPRELHRNESAHSGKPQGRRNEIIGCRTGSHRSKGRACAGRWAR